MTKKQDNITRYWNDMARHGSDAAVIDANDHKGYKNQYIKDICQRNLLERLRHLPQGATILDFGCGTGNLAPLLRSMGFSYRGVDVAMELLAFAKTKTENRDLAVLCYSGHTLPFSDHAFDAVVNVGVLVHLLEDKDLFRALQEIHRVLKPGGTYISLEQTGFSTRIVENHYKKRRSLNNFNALFLQSGFELFSYKYIRNGHFPLIYAIRAGIIPVSLFKLISRVDGLVASIMPPLPFGYRDTIFSLKKPDNNAKCD